MFCGGCEGGFVGRLIDLFFVWVYVVKEGNENGVIGGCVEACCNWFGEDIIVGVWDYLKGKLMSMFWFFGRR